MERIVYKIVVFIMNIILPILALLVLLIFALMPLWLFLGEVPLWEFGFVATGTIILMFILTVWNGLIEWKDEVIKKIYKWIEKMEN